MGNDNPMSAMFTGMMPLIRTKLGDIDEHQLETLANVLAQAFEKVSDPAVSVSEFKEWLEPLSE